MHKLTVTEGILEHPWKNTVRCFIDNDFSYGYWCDQALVETITGKLTVGSTNTFKITKQEANLLIEDGKTPFSKNYIN